MNASQNVVLVDGMSVSGLELNGTMQAYFNADMNQEVSYQTSGVSADRSGGGVTVNMIPREGGNRFSGNGKINYRPGGWIADNFTARLRDMGMHVVRNARIPVRLDHLAGRADQAQQAVVLWLVSPVQHQRLRPRHALR